MTNYCVCIGIDAYVNPGWQLGSCVSDALAFADWAIGIGKVPTDNLRLFLSPIGTTQNDILLPKAKISHPYQPATRNNIIGFVQNQIAKGKWGKGGDRLYWYFAGHGCSHQSVRGEKRPEPVLFPADVEELPLNENNLIGFSDIIEPLRAHGPSRQLFFLDACRDFALADYTSSAGVSGTYFRKLWAEEGKIPNKQYVFYATSPGERAVERGNGIFGDFLIRGLSGDARALLLVAGRSEYQLTYNRLVNFVRKQVQAKVDRALLSQPARVIQIPAVDTDPSEQDFDVAVIPGTEVPSVNVVVRVQPQDAREGRIEVFSDGNPVPPVYGPPLKLLNTLPLKPRYYTIKVSADGMASASQTIEVPLDDVVKFELKPGMEVVSEKKSLKFFSRDESLLVQVWDPENKPHAQLHSVTFQDPKAGLYRAMVSNPDRVSPPQGYTFPSCGHEIELESSPLVANATQIVALEQIGISPKETSVIASEAFGDLSELKVVSLLGLAAYASYVLREGDKGSRLRNFGLAALGTSQRSEAWVTVLVSATGYEPAPGLSVEQFLKDATVVITGPEQRPINELQILPGFNTAGQVLAPCPAGSFSVELQLPGMPARRYAMAGVRGRIAVLALTVDDDQSIEVQEYLFALDRIDLDPKDLPKLEKAQRFYANGRMVPDELLAGLIDAKQMDPLQGCLAGYALIRQHQHRRFVGHFIQDYQGWNPSSPLQNLLNFFDVLPDTHVFAGLCDADRREQHYRNAVQRGIPLFADGFRTLIDYFGDRAAQAFPPAMQRAARTFSSGAIFSSWVSWEPVIGFTETGFDSPPTYWRSLETKRKIIERNAMACGCVASKTDSGKHHPLGSGFLIADDLVLTASHVVQAGIKAGLALPSQDFWFQTEIAPSNTEGIRVAEVMDLDEGARLALLRLESKSSIPPIVVAPAGTVIKPGSEVYIIGYPQTPHRSNVAFSQHVFGMKFGTKRLQPGVVLAAPANERSFDHDASTLPGNGGSPVIDLKTGEAIGVHWGGMDEAGHRRGRATALTNSVNLDFLEELLKKAGHFNHRLLR